MRDELYMIRPDAIIPPDQVNRGIDMSSDWNGRPLVVIEQDGVFHGLTGSHRTLGSCDSRLPSVPCYLVPWEDVCESIWTQFGDELEPHQLPLDELGLQLIADAIRLEGYERTAQVLEDENPLASKRNKTVVYAREGRDRSWLKVWSAKGIVSQVYEADLCGDVLGPAMDYLAYDRIF